MRLEMRMKCDHISTNFFLVFNSRFLNDFACKDVCGQSVIKDIWMVFLFIFYFVLLVRLILKDSLTLRFSDKFEYYNSYTYIYFVVENVIPNAYRLVLLNYCKKYSTLF